MTPKATVMDSMKSMKGKAGTVRSVEVEKADDNSGYITNTRFHSGNEGYYIEPARGVHKNLKSVHEHLKKAYPEKEEK